MTRTPNFGSSQPVSTEDFQERLRRIFADKPDLTLKQPIRPAPRPNRRSPPVKP